MWTFNTIATIDIWSSKIRTIIWYFDLENKDNFHILWIWISDSKAIRKWNILDMEEFKNNLDSSLEEAEKMAWEQINWAYISFNSSSFEIFRNKWVVSVTWWEITEDDINRALEVSKNGVDIPNREILKIIPESFWVDTDIWVRYPIWMTARKLEVNTNIFSINLNVLNNIKKAISDIWIEIYDIYPNLLSSPEWVLSKRQKELWVVCIDIGSSTTWVTVFENWVLNYSTIIPIWWDNVTNDIALWLRTSTWIAEKIKIDYAELGLDEDEKNKNLEFDLAELNMWEQWIVSKLFLSKVVTARYEEIFYFVREELKKIWKDWMLPEWAICVWWWVKIKWFVELWKKTLKLPVFIWTPVSKDQLIDTSISDPVFVAVIWTMILSNMYWNESNIFSFNIFWFWDSIKKLFKKIIPK